MDRHRAQWTSNVLQAPSSLTQNPRRTLLAQRLQIRRQLQLVRLRNWRRRRQPHAQRRREHAPEGLDLQHETSDDDVAERPGEAS